MKHLFLASALMAVQDVPPDAAYLPLKVGNTWEYKAKGSEQARVRKITGRDADGTWRQEDSTDGKTERKDALKVGKAGLTCVGITFGEAEVVPSEPLLLLKFPARKDDSWTQEVDFSGQKATIKTVTAEEKVKVPAGEYTALKVTLTGTMKTNDATLTIILTAWYVKDVGVVRHSLKADLDGAELMADEAELVKYTPAKEEKEVERKDK
jgi:hypothetical protein